MGCSIDGCEQVPRVRGLCSYHYKRWSYLGFPRRWIPDCDPASVPVVCVCDTPRPDVIGECAVCGRPFKPCLAEARALWRRYVMTLESRYVDMPNTTREKV
jgi:hypothetical protein